MANKDTIYFQHDFNARTDPKIIRLRKQHGWLGYGIYWAVLEILRENDGLLKYNELIDMSFSLQINDELYESIINACINEYSLFEKDSDGNVFSRRLCADIDHMKEKSANASASARKRWDDYKEKKAKREKSKSNTTVMRTHNDSITDEEKTLSGSNAKEYTINTIVEDRREGAATGVTAAQPPVKEDVILPELKTDFFACLKLILESELLRKVPQNLSAAQYEKLRDFYTQEQIIQTLTAMANHKSVKKSQTIYLTLINWMSKDFGKGDTLQHYDKFEDEYREFIKKKTDGIITARLNATDKKHLRNIMTSLKESTASKTFEGGFEVWKMMLSEWDKLDKFMQQRTKLSEMDSDMVKIIAILKTKVNERAKTVQGGTGNNTGHLTEQKTF